MQQYSLSQRSIEALLSDEITIPDIQRPFVWNATRVRDFIDSLYSGYPVGYLITWRNQDVRPRDGTQAAGGRILIDGQQRVKALRTALLGEQVVDQDYQQTRIIIAFHPGQERFEVANPTTNRSQAWISDIAAVFAPGARMYRLVGDYCEANQDVDRDEIDERMERLRGIRNNSLGLIELNADLDVETVAEIFVRINSKGVTLNAADFAMSRMAASEQYDGHLLSQCIRYFCHLAVDPEAHSELVQDDDFANTDYFRAMEWLRDETEDLYTPSYTDMLRVTFTSEFQRGRLADLVALLSGRNFETHTFEDVIAEESFCKLKEAVLRYMNKTNFKNFILILRSAGFVDPSMIRSQNTVNFAYILYLTLRVQGTDATEITTLVRRWFVMSVLTGRYTGSSETAFGDDIRQINEQGADQYLETIESTELTDDFWNFTLPQQMVKSGASSPHFKVFLASQVTANEEGYSSSHDLSGDLISPK